jgi:predicted ATP-grasp superfamily ATP-dependent carboligase
MLPFQKNSGRAMTNIVIVGKSRYIVLAVLQAIQSYTDANILLMGDDETNLLKWSALCAEKIDIRFDGSTDNTFLDAVNCFANMYPDATLLAVDCDGMRITNRLRERLRIEIAATPDPQTLEMFDDKWLFHQFCVKQNLRVPTTRFIGTKDRLDYDAIVAEFSVPFVVKPTNMAGSIGVQIVTSKADFENSILFNDGYQHHSLIVQRYVDGRDIDLSLLSIDGVLSAFAIQQVNGPMVEFLQNAYLETVASEICRRSRYNGVIHIDARIEKRTGLVYLIEANPRFWASLTASVACGLNFVAEIMHVSSAPSHPRTLMQGEASSRHPALRPSSWRRLAMDAGYRGRLLRAKAFDPYSLGQLAIDLSSSWGRFARNKSTRRMEKKILQKA